MEHKMKSSKIKTIVVECRFTDSVNSNNFEVDSDIFEDVYMEAATRFIEGYIKENNTKIAPILETYEQKDLKKPNKHFCYNSYYVIVNAGFYKKAEIMRQNFKNLCGVDLKKESIRGENKKNGNFNSNN